MDDQEIAQTIYETFGKLSVQKNSDGIGDTSNQLLKDLDPIPPPSSYFPPDMEAQVVKLKRALEGWREVILPVNSLLLWEKQWHPSAILGGTTIIFFSLWLLDPSILTTLCILGLTVTISDYMIPVIASSIFKAELWTGNKEKSFEDICRSVVIYKTKVTVSCDSYYLMRTTRPRMYYGCTIASLAFLAWIGNNFNNLFLTFLIVCFLLLLPGMEHHGIIHKYGMLITQKISELATSAKTKVQTKID